MTRYPDWLSAVAQSDMARAELFGFVWNLGDELARVVTGTWRGERITIEVHLSVDTPEQSHAWGFTEDREPARGRDNLRLSQSGAHDQVIVRAISWAIEEGATASPS